MAHDEEDIKQWRAEWKLWAAVSIVIVAVWAVWSGIRGQFDNFWPLGVIGIWAAVLLSAPLWPSRSAKRSESGDDGRADDRPRGSDGA